jgi:hypothetical protein
MSFTTPTASISDATGISELPTSNQDPAAVSAAIASPENALSQPPAPVAPTVPVTVSNLTVKAPNTTFARYATVLFTALITIGSASQILPEHHTTQDLVQFGIILVGAIGTALSSVTTGPWPGIFKTGFASLAAILTLLVPYLANGVSLSSITTTNWIVFGVAAANALATELGVDIRMKANQKTEENLLK